MKQKLLSGLIVLMLLFTSFGSRILPVQAAPGKSLEEAIIIAKNSFPVPPEYSEFTSHYNEHGTKFSWWLNWSGKEGEMSIEVDAVTGDVTRMHQYASGQRGAVKLPKLSYKEAKAIADGLVKKLQPQKAKDLILQVNLERPSLDINPWGPPRYDFRYQRSVEGIPFSGNGINITINGDTGDILSYSLDWYGEKLVVPQKMLSSKEAQQIFSQQFPLELVYFRAQQQKKNEIPSVKLVYQLRNPERVLIDPVSGKVLEPEADFGAFGGYGRESMDQSAKSMNEAPVLTPEEEKEVTKMESLISKEEAIKSALKVLKLSEEYKLDSSGLQNLWDEPGKVVWQLSWRGGKEQDYKGYVGATVDGETGELLDFHSYQYDEEQGKKGPVYDLEQSKELAWALIEELQPEKAKEVKYYPSGTNKGNKSARSYRFVFERLINGIPFPQNGFEINVNAVTGKVESYSLRWSKADFPKANTVIDSIKATNWYGEDVPLTLEFLTSYGSESNEPKVSLLYHLSKVPYTMLDAVSGMPLNWQGEPLEKAKPAVFSDIKNHPAETDIELLATAGVIEGTKDGKFYPDAAITQGELAKMLAKLERDQGPIIPLPRLKLDPEAWYTPWINDVVSKGIIEAGEVDPEETVTREFLAATLIRHLGLEQAAALSDLFQLRFEDGQEIMPKYRGHVALADGLKIVSSQENFLPKKQVTRAEAATALVKTLQLD